MGTDNLHLINRRKKKIREEAKKEIKPYRYLIVCEGEKTEPLYFKVLKTEVEKRFREIIDLKEINFNDELIVLDGTGKNTESLVDYTLNIRNKANIPYGDENVWCVFDKDSFTDEQFNNAIQKAEDNGIKVAWSNEAIELWFILHFEYLNTGITRKDYIKKLDVYFKKYNINNGKYEKNQEKIYEILKRYGNQEFAVKNAEKLLKNNTETPSKTKPATTVYKLVKELEGYLKDKKSE